jgi:hypothetical protein
VNLNFELFYFLAKSVLQKHTGKKNTNPCLPETQRLRLNGLEEMLEKPSP